MFIETITKFLMQIKIVDAYFSTHLNFLLLHAPSLIFLGHLVRQKVVGHLLGAHFLLSCATSFYCPRPHPTSCPPCYTFCLILRPFIYLESRCFNFHEHPTSCNRENLMTWVAIIDTYECLVNVGRGEGLVVKTISKKTIVANSQINQKNQ